MPSSRDRRPLRNTRNLTEAYRNDVYASSSASAETEEDYGYVSRSLPRSRGTESREVPHPAYPNRQLPSRYDHRSPIVPSAPAIPVETFLSGEEPPPPRSNSARFSQPSSHRSSSGRHSQSSHSDSTNDDTSEPGNNAEATPRTARERLNEYQSTMGRSNVSDRYLANVGDTSDPEDADLTQRLAAQAFHLPGNTWKQDWWQYMLNNHLVLGICFHHPRHPIGACTRMAALLGTIVMGVVMTNLFYLFYLSNPRFNQEVLTVVTGSGDDWSLTTGMLLLWTLGGCVHAGYNVFLWHIAACGCCRAGGCCESKACCPSFGKHLLRVLVGITIGLAVLVVFLRVAITSQENELSDNAMDDSMGSETEAPTQAPNENGGLSFLDPGQIDLDVDSAQEFQFLLGYCVEMVLALFVYHPIGGTILFAGVFGCGGRIPVLGGRPYEVALEERRQRKRKERLAAVTGGTTGNAPKVTVLHDLELQRDWTADESDDTPGRRR